MAPEGRDFPKGVLGWPPPGTKRLLVQLGRFVDHFVHVGVYEGNDQLVINFGEPIKITNLDHISMDLENEISRQMMQAIARLLPERLRGEFK